jgi:hypothetical protein
LSSIGRLAGLDARNQALELRLELRLDLVNELLERVGGLAGLNARDQTFQLVLELGLDLVLLGLNKLSQLGVEVPGLAGREWGTIHGWGGEYRN